MVINPVLITQIPQNLAQMCILGYIWGSCIKDQIWPNLRNLRDHFVSFTVFHYKGHNFFSGFLELLLGFLS